MKLVSRNLGRLLKLAAVGAATLMSQQAMAVGTAAGSTITNTATVNYSVGGVGQTAIQDSDAGFVVDNRVDMTIVQSGNLGRTITTPDQADNVTEFLLTNTGNQSQGYQLNPTAVNGPDFQMLNERVFVESGANAGYQPGQDTATVVDTLAADDSAIIYILADTPAAASDTQTSDVTLNAVTTAAGTGAAAPLAASGSPTAGEDVVLAVGGVNGTGDATQTDGYIVEVVLLVVTKTVVTTSDPFGGAFSVPGAVVVYDVAVQNPSATTAATNVVVTDIFTDLLNEAPASETVTISNGFDSASNPVASCTIDLNDTDGDGCGVNSAVDPQTMTLGNGNGLGTFSIPANATTTYQFQVVIQ